MALEMLNPNSDRVIDALEMNVRAAISLKDILKSNLGPKGKLKMLVSGSGDITLTKDGCVLLKNMQIEHPTANLIARNTSAQDEITGDGSLSLVLFIGELMSQSFYHHNEGVHPRVISEGIEFARKKSLEFLAKYVTEFNEVEDKEFLRNVARTSLRTKLTEDIADHLTNIIVDSVMTIRIATQPIDLYMVELMTMEHKSVFESTLVNGIVLDHGFRHPLMPKVNKNCFILTCNIALEYEKTEVNSQFYFSDASQREKMVQAERHHINNRLKDIINLKNKAFESTKDKNVSFVVINQKGIDPLSLDYLHKNGIVALRRAKRRNMERLTLACGGKAMNSTDQLSLEVLGYAGCVSEHTLGEERFTFVQDVKKPRSCTVLLRGPNNYSIQQMKDSVRDGLRAVKSVLEEKKAVAGAGSFELACHMYLKSLVDDGEMKPNAVGTLAFAEALLSIPKVLAANSGFEPIDCIARLKASFKNTKGEFYERKIGLNLEDGSVMSPGDEGVWDNFRAKRQLIHLGAIQVENLLFVDEVLRAGKVSK